MVLCSFGTESPELQRKLRALSTIPARDDDRRGQSRQRGGAWVGVMTCRSLPGMLGVDGGLAP